MSNFHPPEIVVRGSTASNDWTSRSSETQLIVEGDFNYLLSALRVNSGLQRVIFFKVFADSNELSASRNSGLQTWIQGEWPPKIIAKSTTKTSVVMFYDSMYVKLNNN